MNLVKQLCASLLGRVSGNLPLSILISVIVVICGLNYTPGSFLTGWDTLHPEFDFSLNLKRVLFGVFREEQGLGAVAGHSHMADLPRILYLFVSSLFLPTSFLRYFYFFTTLILGPIGVYAFLSRTLFKDKPTTQKQVFSSLGGAFYFLNLGTLQHFYVPFEMFATLYAGLPWLLFTAINYLEKGSKKYLACFGLVTFLATPMAYAATLWYGFFGYFLLFLSSSLLLNNFNRLQLKRSLLLIVTTVLLNSYWLLPNLHLLSTSGVFVANAKMNQLFSENAFLYDKKFATLDNAALLQGFLFDWQEYEGGKFTDLLNEWQAHINNPLIFELGIIFACIGALGLIASIKHRNLYVLSLLVPFAFVFIFLIHSYPPFAWIFSFLRDKLEIFREGLRFPWTKFSIEVMFSYTIFFSYGVYVLYGQLEKRLNYYHYKAIYPTFALTLLALIVFMWPAFQGNLLSKSMRVHIPGEYFDLFNWFGKQPENQRIAKMPIPGHFGWEYYDWNFEGAGFLWFGLKQPILERDFDRWNPNNENYYWELSYALYSQNKILFENVFEKYQIQWLIVDKNIIHPTSPRALFADEIKQTIDSSPKFVHRVSFGDIDVYQVNPNVPIKGFVYTADTLPNLGPVYKWNNYDRGFLDFGHYKTDESFDVYYPFRSLFSGKNSTDIEYNLTETQDSFLLTGSFQKGKFKDHYLRVPQLQSQELLEVNGGDFNQINLLSPEIYQTDSTIELAVPKVNGYGNKIIDPSGLVSDKSSLAVKNCNQKEGGAVENRVLIENEKTFLRLLAKNANNCTASIWIPDLPNEFGYVITAQARNVKGKSLLFWLENLNNRRADIESPLNVSNRGWNTYRFTQPPMQFDDTGYMLHFDNMSIGNDTSVNDLGPISIYPFPYNFASGFALVPQSYNPSTQFRNNMGVTHPNPGLYEIILNDESSEGEHLILSQAFDKGWKAYRVSKFINPYMASVFGKSIDKHVLVNNWGNGWVLPELQNEKIVLIYTPQYFQMFGFLTFISTVFWLMPQIVIRLSFASNVMRPVLGFIYALKSLRTSGKLKN